MTETVAKIGGYRFDKGISNSLLKKNLSKSLVNHVTGLLYCIKWEQWLTEFLF